MGCQMWEHEQQSAAPYQWFVSKPFLHPKKLYSICEHQEITLWRILCNLETPLKSWCWLSICWGLVTGIFPLEQMKRLLCERLLQVTVSACFWGGWRYSKWWFENKIFVFFPPLLFFFTNLFTWSIRDIVLKKIQAFFFVGRGNTWTVVAKK